MKEENVIPVNSGKRLAYFDTLKCLGILLVISGHVQFFGMNIKAYDSPPTLMLYSFNMPLFFFISGYLAFKEDMIGNMKGVRKTGNKFQYLVLPAIVFYVFSSLLEQGGNIFGFFEYGLGKYWFTFTLFEMFMIYYCVISLIKSKTGLAISLILLSISGLCYLNFFSKYDIAFFDFNHLMKYFQFFTLGVLSKMYFPLYDKVMRNEWIKATSIILFFTILFMLYKITLPNIVHHLLRDIVLRYLGLYIVVSLFYCKQEIFSKDNRINSIIQNIGKNSLAIYLLQYFFMPDFSGYPQWLKSLDWLSIYAISFGYTVFITALCMLFIYLLSNSTFVKKYALGKK